MTRTIRIGSGSGFSEDLVEPAEDLAKFADLEYLIFEALAERTIHEGHMRRLSGENPGYGLRFEERMRRCAIPCLQRGTKIISNDGAANPAAAAEWLGDYLTENHTSAKIAVVDGDDVVEYFRENRDVLFSQERYQVLSASDAWTPADPTVIRDNIESANVYLFHDPMREALDHGADIVIAGRVADPSMFVAAILHEFGWQADEWDRVAFGTVVGHLLECSGHSTGGYFADCEHKISTNLANIGFPIAEVSDDETALITKLENSGGAVTKLTVMEQLHYEVHSFKEYVTPDVIADFTGIEITEVGPDRVKVQGARGKDKPQTLKVLLGYHHGYNTATSIRYRGHNALRRAKLVGDTWSERLRHSRHDISDSVYLYNDLPYEAAHHEDPDPKYVEFRYSAIVPDEAEGEKVALHFMGFYLNGPYGGGGIESAVTRFDPLIPLIIPRGEVQSSVTYVEV